MTAKLMQNMSKELSQKFWQKFLWMHPDYSKKFRHSYDTLQSNQPGCNILSLLISTSTLERLLGDIFAIRRTPVPSLLKDLLSSTELHEIFGHTFMSLLEVLIGPPISLNLRNLAWHGFIAPSELHSEYCYFLLAVVAFIGNYLQKMSTLVHIPRPLVNTSIYIEELNIFPILTDSLCEEIELCLNSNSIPCPLLPCWNGAFLAYKENRFSDCLILILPQLETILRIIFTKVNQCPHRMLTAESSTLYTTFAEIFNQDICDKKNLLREIIGDEYLVILLELLEMPNGPRLRDRLSHGEIELNTVSKELANHTLCLSIIACFMMNKNEKILQEKTFLILFSCMKNYIPRFAVQYNLLKQMILLLKSLNFWKSLSLIPNHVSAEKQNVVSTNIMDNDDVIKVENLPVTTEISDLIISSRQYFQYKIQPYVSPDELNRYLYFPGDFSVLNAFISSLKIPVLYRPPKEIEIITCLKHVIEYSIESSMQVEDALKNRFEEYMNHKLRSRQRETYHRMIKVILYINLGIKVVLLVTIIILAKIQEETEEFFNLNKRYIRSITHYIENLKIMTSNKKNRWIESKELTKNFLSIALSTALFS